MGRLGYRTRALLDRMYPYFMDVFVISDLAATIVIVAYFLVPLIVKFDQITEANKISVIENILQGTLTLGAIALTVLGYAFSQMQHGESTKERAPYKRIAYIMYLITPLSMADVGTSISFLLTREPYSFQVSLILLYIIVVGLMLSVSLWVRKEWK